MVRKVWLTLAGMVLSACGGGGGGEEDNSSWLTFTPSPVVATAYVGETLPVTVTARSSRTISDPVNVGIVDTAGVLSMDVSVVAVSATEYNIRLRVSRRLPVGTYTGSIEVRLCRDHPDYCHEPHPGSPWRVPYHFTVQSSTNLTPLQPLAGAGTWTTYQGNASHTGYVAANLDPARFSRRWSRLGSASSVAAENGRVFSIDSFGTGQWGLRAVSEETGDVLWARGLDTQSVVSPPTVSDGKVFVASTGLYDRFLWTFDAVTGEQLARTPMSADPGAYAAATVHAGHIYVGSVSRFEAATSTLDWSVPLAQQHDRWTPAVDDNAVYAYAGAQLHVLQPDDGSSIMTIADPRFEAGWWAYGAPVLDGQGGVFVTQFGRLIKFDVARGVVAWDLSQAFYSNPVLANGTLYVLNGDRVEARSPATGTLLWSWTAPGGSSAAESTWHAGLVVVGSIAFVGTSGGTHAIDLNTRQSIWNDPATGELAVSSNGILYISSAIGEALVAINLR
jgi:outer membrane protein assembly factor BamB